jgi:peptidoglycan/xylan/chitin deacetylase (PgdA/CDA1 family)
MTDGRLVLVFDDGYIEDHEIVRPVLDRLDASAVFAIVPTWLGEDDT